MVSRVVGFCGMVCSNCLVFKATLENGDVERKRVAELFTKQYGREYKPADINCDGCVSDSERIFNFCSICGIRRCGHERRVKNCAYCAAYPCERLDEVFTAYPKARQTLDDTRRSIGNSDHSEVSFIPRCAIVCAESADSHDMQEKRFNSE